MENGSQDRNAPQGGYMNQMMQSQYSQSQANSNYLNQQQNFVNHLKQQSRNKHQAPRHVQSEHMVNRVMQQQPNNFMQQSVAVPHTSSSLVTQGSRSDNSNFKVQIRVRPPLQRERQGNTFRGITQVSKDARSLQIMEYLGQEYDEREKARDIERNPHLCVWHSYSFDYVYDQPDSQEQVYSNTAKHQVKSVLEGYNATILAYGQTGTGKTHTMEGFKYNSGDPQRGIVPRSMEDIFTYVQLQQNQNTTFMVRASYLQIYNEVISDLLKVERTSLQIREDKKKGVFVEGLSEWAVKAPSEIYSLMQKGALSRATATTKMNDLSSRSHAVFIIIVEQMTSYPGAKGDDEAKQIKVGKLNLVDLAGSERVRVTGATGKRLEESKKINQSLSCLGNVIAALTDQKPRSHIPYRDSKLTRILEDSLGGNCKTTMMAMISPSADAFAESHSTLKFATRAKKIKNHAHINEDVDQRALLRKYEVELRILRTELAQRNMTMQSGSYPGQTEDLLKLEKEKRRAEEDKNAAINALEQRSAEFNQAQEQKKMLEEKIKSMNSQMLVGGKTIQDTPQFRSALEEHQRLIRQEYEHKLGEIERERNQIEEDKAQVDRYKQLLLKQRDIMIALTSRLNERDETIIQLQEELDAYDRIHRETEQVIEFKQARIDQLENFIAKDCRELVPPNPYEREDQVRQLLFQPSIYDPQFYHDQVKLYQANDSESQQPKMLTAEEKIQELQMLLDSNKSTQKKLKGRDDPEDPAKMAYQKRVVNDIAQQSLQELAHITSGLAKGSEMQLLQKVQNQLTSLTQIVGDRSESSSPEINAEHQRDGQENYYNPQNLHGQPFNQIQQNTKVTLYDSSLELEDDKLSNNSSVANSIPQSVSEMLRKRTEEKQRQLKSYIM